MVAMEKPPHFGARPVPLQDLEVHVLDPRDTCSISSEADGAASLTATLCTQDPRPPRQHLIVFCAINDSSYSSTPPGAAPPKSHGPRLQLLSPQLLEPTALLRIRPCRLLQHKASCASSSSEAATSTASPRRFPGNQKEYEAALQASTTVYIGNMSFYTTEEQVCELFSRAGEIKKIIMSLD